MSATHVRERALRERAMHVLSYNQRQRFDKIFTEPFYLISVREASNAHRYLLQFDVSGSRADSYCLSLACDGTISCTCRDAIFHTRQRGCVCKHVCFLLYRVLQLSEDPPFAFFRNRVLTADKVQQVCATVRSNHLNFRPGIFSVSTRVDSAPTGTVGDQEKFKTIRKQPEPTDNDCPICLLPLLDDPPTRLLSCPACHNNVHETCMRTWLYLAPQKTCVYCRDVVWREFTY